MTIEVIKDVDYPTNVLAVAIANMYHALECPKWKQNATVPVSIKLPLSETIHDTVIQNISLKEGKWNVN